MTANAPAGGETVVEDRLILTDDTLYVLPRRTAIRYEVISHINAIKDRHDLHIFHGRTFWPLDNDVTNVTFQEPSARDRALEALERQLAPRFRRREVQHGPLRAALRPLGGGCLAALFTWASVPAAALVIAGEESYFYRPGTSKARMFIPLFRLLGPKGVAIVGGLTVLVCLVLSVKRFAQPPHVITLSRD